MKVRLSALCVYRFRSVLFTNKTYFGKNIRLNKTSCQLRHQLQRKLKRFSTSLRSTEIFSRRLWDNICVTLNAMGGCTKTTKQWLKVWTDKKYLAKKAAAAAHSSASATGGGPSSAPQLSQWELRVLSIMGDGFGEPQTTARVPLFIEQTQDSTMQEVQGTSLPSQQDVILLLSDQLPAENSQPTELPAPTEPQIRPSMSSQATISSNITQRTRRPRAVRHLSGSQAGSVRERLFSLEEERREREIFRNERLLSINENLAGIMLTLQEMCRLMKQVTEKLPRHNE